MAKFHVDNRLAGSQQALTTTFKTQVALTAATATLCRGRIYEMNFGADGAPNSTDCNIVYDVSRQTAAGTSTGLTPLALDPANVASRTVGSGNFTAEGTITATSTVFDQTLNQRASQRWVAMDQDSMLFWPATNLAGLAFRALSPTYTGNVLANIYYEDL
jgi:hypothetical protein